MTYDFWLEWRLNFTVLNLLPIDATEEAVISDVLLSITAAAQPLLWILSQELLGGK